MKRKLLILLSGIISVSIIGIGFGIYFWFNQISGINKDLESGSILLEGMFIEFDSNHYGRGSVQIVELLDGSREIQFIDVEIASGPDLFVYLSDKSSFSGTNDDPGDYTNIGGLNFNAGNFSMYLHEAIALSNVNSILIWCRQFSVAFTYASLN